MSIKEEIIKAKRLLKRNEGNSIATLMLKQQLTQIGRVLEEAERLGTLSKERKEVLEWVKKDLDRK